MYVCVLTGFYDFIKDSMLSILTYSFFGFDQSYKPPKRADNTSVTQKKWVTEVK